MGVEGDATTYGALMRACERGGQWRRSLSRFRDMREAGVKPDLMAYTAAISACGRGGKGSTAERVFLDMLDADVAVDAAACNALMSALARSGKTEEALEMLDTMSELGVRVLLAPSALVSSLGNRRSAIVSRRYSLGNRCSATLYEWCNFLLSFASWLSVEPRGRIHTSSLP